MGVESKNIIAMELAEQKMLSVLVLSRSTSICADVAQAFIAMPQLTVESYVIDNGHTEEIPKDISRPDVIILDVGTGTLEEVALIEKLLGNQGDAHLPIVALLDRGSTLGPVRAMRAGATDVLFRPVDAEEASEVFLRLRTAQKVVPLHSGGGASGRMIAFHHVSGGAGATTLAVNSAEALTTALGKDKACLIDLDIQFGAVGSLLDLSRFSRLEDFIEDPRRLDGEMLETLTVQHRSGLRVFTAPRFPIPLDALDEVSVLHLLKVAKSKFAFTIVDTPVAVTPWTASILQSADIIYLVVELTIPDAHRTRRFLEFLESEGMSRLPIKLVANRLGSKTASGNQVSLSKFAKAIGHNIDYSIPNDYGLISLSREQGRTAIELKPKSKFAQTLRQMLSKELGDDVFAEKARSRFLFGRR